MFRKSLLALFLLFISNNSSADGHSSGDVALEGMGVWSINALGAGKGTASVTYDGLMTVKAVSGTKFAHNASFRCDGGLLAFKGEITEENGFCKILFQDGDTAFLQYDGTGKMGVGSEGSWRFIGGSGKYEKISGSGIVKRKSIKAAATGYTQSINFLTGSYSIK